MPNLPVEPLPQSDVGAQQQLQPSVIDRLLGTNGVERYQLWPERLVRSAVSAPHGSDAARSGTLTSTMELNQ